MQKVIISFVIFVFALGLRFGSSSPVEPIIQPKTQVERQLNDSRSIKAYQGIEDSKSPSVRSLLNIAGGDLGKASSPGARARSDAARNAKPTTGQSTSNGGSSLEAWTQNPSIRSRPEAANRLGRQLQDQGGGGFFDRLLGRPKRRPDPHNPGCSIGPRSITVLSNQNKAGIDQLPDSSKFIYGLDGKAAKKGLKKVWNNSQAKKEVLAGLTKMDRGELLPRNQKDFKGFKTIKEIKLTDTRMLVQPGKNGGPDKIVAIIMRRDLKEVSSKLQTRYK